MSTPNPGTTDWVPIWALQGNANAALYQLRSEKAQPSGYASLDAGGFVPVAQIPSLSATYQVVSAKGAANGYASLDGSTKVPIAQIPTMDTAHIPDLSATYQVVSAKGAINGYASLDASGLVPAAQLPASATLPAGGTAGQVLSKISSTNYSTQWSTTIKTLSGLFSARPSAASVPVQSTYYATDTGVTYVSDGVSTWTAVHYGLLPGGTTGQAFVKTSNADYAVAW